MDRITKRRGVDAQPKKNVGKKQAGKAAILTVTKWLNALASGGRERASHEG
jgi:hypothetical protein